MSARLALAYQTDYFTGETIDSEVQTIYLLCDRNAKEATCDSSNYIWRFFIQSIYEVDTGYRWMRITHELNANIHYSDTVTFELAFTSDYDQWTDPVNDMLEDAARCIVSQNADDTRFWITTTEDYYYTCANVNCSN